MRPEPVSETTFGATLQALMDTNNMTIGDTASLCRCSKHTIHYLLGGGSAGLRVTRSIVETFGLEKDPKMLRRIFIGYLLQKFPAEWLAAADLVLKE